MSIFKLQQFSVKQTISGMKICSDSLIFGAMIPVDTAIHILDIGAGTGILSLMLAQQLNARSSLSSYSITAVELTAEAAEEAQFNFENSPWSEQLTIIEQEIQQFSNDHVKAKHQRFDLIISNPPFFMGQSKTSSDNPLRHTARHGDSLSFEDLCQSIECLLSDQGHAYVLLPIVSIDEFCMRANELDLILLERTDIAESGNHAVKVSVLHFIRGGIVEMAAFKQNRIDKFIQPNTHSKEVRSLLSPFLLRYAQ